MRQPDGFNDGTGRICQLRHTLYGLKQSSREWNKTLSIFLKSIRFTKLVSENCVFIRHDNDEFNIIAVWVDDLFIVTTNDVRKNHLKAQIHKEFEATDQGEPKLLLGIEINRNRKSHSIMISQGQYIGKILQRFRMEDCKPAMTPLLTGIQYQPSMDDEAFEDPSLYRSAIRSLMYAAIATCPDIAYAINSLSQFNIKPLKKHWNTVKHIFRYLQGTRDIGITFDMDSRYADFIISSFSDSDNRKSFHKKAITGGAILLAGVAIKNNTKKKT